MPSPPTHPWDEATQEIVDWLTNESSYYAEALRGGYATPFSASVNEAQKLDYYRRQVFQTNLDGTPDYSKPNAQGRDMLIKRIGIPGYTQVMAAVLPRGTGAPVDETQSSSDLPTLPEGQQEPY